MDTVRHRLGSSLSWLRSQGDRFNSSLLLDSLAVPFTDSQLDSSSAPSSSSDHRERALRLEANDGDLSQGEDDRYSQAGLSTSYWGFLASRYALTLGITAIVVDRITHICRPQGRPRALPTARRLAIQLPTIAFLAYSGLLLFLITTHFFFPQSSGVKAAVAFLRLPSDAKALLDLANHSEDEIQNANTALLWRLFLSICLAVVSSSLLRTLEGNNRLNIHPDEYGNSPAVNLIGFAIFLHSASSHAFPPNKNIYLSILFQVGEVLGLQIRTCWVHRPPVSRLAWTTIFGLASTVHYLFALRFGDHRYVVLQGVSRAPDVGLIAIIILTIFLHALTAAITDTRLSLNRLIDPHSLPAPTDDYSMALFKIGTACLNSTRLSGMDSDLIDINTSAETWLEVKGTKVTVIGPDGRVATAARSIDGKGGLTREIRKIKASHDPNQRDNPVTNDYFAQTRWREGVKFGRTLVRTLQAIGIIAVKRVIACLPFGLHRMTTPNWMLQLPRRVRLLWHGTNGEERRNARLQESRQRREVQQRRAESDQLFRERAERARLAGAASSTAVAPSYQDASGLTRRDRALSLPSSLLTPWQRFFSHDFPEDDDDEWQDEDGDERGEPGMDADAEYWQALGAGSQLAHSLGEDDDGEDDEDGDDGDGDEGEGEDGALDISSELLTLANVEFEEEGGHEPYARVLMAHLAHRSQGMLTRRGYQQLVGGHSRAEQEAQQLIDVIRQRRRRSSSPSGQDLTDRDRMRLCVICYIEDRTIICWPCKCMALCEGCREAMVARPPPRSHLGHNGTNSTNPTHNCPTCRTPVIGFSRIFVP